MTKQPIQPIVKNESGEKVFKENQIVRFLFNFAKSKGIDLSLLRETFPWDDYEQFLQLKGCSVNMLQEYSQLSDDEWKEIEVASLKVDDYNNVNDGEKKVIYESE